MVISIYLIVAIVCAALLVIMAALGDFSGDADFDVGVDADVDFDVGGDVDLGHGDFSGAGISPLSIPILLIFGTGFGSVGTILEALAWDVYLVPIVALAVSGLLTAVIFVIMVKVFINTQGSTAVGLSDLVGLEGLVTIQVTAKEPGQIMVVTEGRGRVTAPAIANEPIPTNSQIKVIGVVGDSLMIESIAKMEV